MKLSSLVQLLNAKIYTNNYDENKTVQYAFSCDLMSDALMLLRNAPIFFCDEGVLVTGLATIQGVKTAEMLDLGIVILARGKVPNESTINEAQKLNIIIIGTNNSMFSTNGLMYKEGIKGISDI